MSPRRQKPLHKKIGLNILSYAAKEPSPRHETRANRPSCTREHPKAKEVSNPTPRSMMVAVLTPLKVEVSSTDENVTAYFKGVLALNFYYRAF
jgi:hypothetical protein